MEGGTTNGLWVTGKKKNTTTHHTMNKIDRVFHRSRFGAKEQQTTWSWDEGG